MCDACELGHPVYVEFTAPFDKAFCTDISKKIYYISEDILDFELHTTETEVVGISLYFKHGAKVEQILQHLQLTVQKDIVGLKSVKVNRVWNYDEPAVGRSGDVLEELISRGYVRVHGEGQVSIKEPYVDLFEWLDRTFEGIARDMFGAERYMFPTLLKTSILKQVGYFDSFPNLLMFVVRLHNSVENFDAFRKEFEHAKSNEQITAHLMKYVCETEYSLPPTMCYYVYDMFSDQEFTQNRAVTARGKSFRFENKYHRPLQRLWDFTIRETVFLGDYDYVRHSIEGYRKAATQLMETLGLHGFCETANDPFFLMENTTGRINTQKMLGSKYELQLRLNSDETMACGSFNLHSQFLSKKFRLYKNRAEEQYIYTGCVGIGLERMFFVFLSQYGIDPGGWPEIVRKGICEVQK